MSASQYKRDRRAIGIDDGTSAIPAVGLMRGIGLQSVAYLPFGLGGHERQLSHPANANNL